MPVGEGSVVVEAHRTLGINGLGRIGKLLLWRALSRPEYGRVVVNVGRPVGTSLASLVEYLQKDSTYGPLHRWLRGVAGEPDVTIVDEKHGVLRVHGREVVVLRQDRNPGEIAWRDLGVRVVVDCTGRFTDPTIDASVVGGSLRGHLAAGADVVIQSSPFKLSAGAGMPDDAIMMVRGINDHLFDPTRHKIVSAASCTTTALAHMMRPLLDHDLTERIATACMSTVHAATNSQSVLDTVPAAGARDLRKTRGALGNIIITSTGAAKALEWVMPEIRRIGFMGDSVRIPIASGSLIILNVTFHGETHSDGTTSIDAAAVNDIYRRAAEGVGRGLVKFSTEQNVSSDMVNENAAVVIEALETHSRTGFMSVPTATGDLEVPLTHVKICGWYDNEMGSYTNRLGELADQIVREF